MQLFSPQSGYPAQICRQTLMPRSIGFDAEEKLHAAMLLFWRKGYEATSLADLVAELGINRFSIYNTFGDKQQLFQQVDTSNPIK